MDAIAFSLLAYILFSFLYCYAPLYSAIQIQDAPETDKLHAKQFL